jgi:DNA-binding MarR family transcriptional regulator
MLQQWRREATIFVHEIMATARRISCARDFGGQPVIRTDAHWLLLCALERAQGCLSIADVGRALRVSRQAAHELVSRMARTGQVEFLAHPSDRRIVHIELTPLGKSALAASHAREAKWVLSLLNGLEPRDMRATAHVLYVIRQRLIRNERQIRG